MADALEAPESEDAGEELLFEEGAMELESESVEEDQAPEL